MEVWYPLFKQLTPITISEPLTKEEALILKYYSENVRRAVVQLERMTNQIDPSHVIGSGYSYGLFTEAERNIRLTEEQRETLRGLECKFDQVIRQVMEGGSTGAFVKLSTRSPKDAGIWTDYAMDLLEEEVIKFEKDADQKKYGLERRWVNDVISYTRIASYSLKVTNGSEAIKLFSRSERVSTDILFAELMSNDDSIPLDLIIREWSDDIYPEWEFRVFVWNKRITAITQYYSDCYVPEIAENKEMIKTMITDYLNEKVVGLIPHDVDHLTLDVAVSKNLDGIIFLELGNPPPVAGTGLYSFENKLDRDIIQGLKGTEVDMRVLEKYPEGAWDRLHNSIKRKILELPVQKRSVEKKSKIAVAPSLTILVIILSYILYLLNPYLFSS